MGYHKREIPKGKYGDFSKIEEEWHELLDAHEQAAAILELCELADLVGAIHGYVEKNYNLNIHDVLQMSRMTRESFTEGTRK